MAVHPAELGQVRQLVQAGHITDRWEDRVLNDGAQEDVRTESRRLGRRPGSQDCGRHACIAHDELAVLLANRLSPALELKEREAVVPRLDLRVVAPRDQIAAR